MNRSQYVITNHALRDNDGVLIVVTLPRHVSHEEVATECELAVLCSVTLCEDVALLNALTLVADRTQVDGHVLVGAAELRNAVLLESRLEAYELLVVGAGVEDADCCSVYVFDNALALCSNHCTRVLAHLLLKTCTYDRCVVVEQWHCLAHHVTSHECTVTVVVLQERDKTCRYRCNLLRRDIHEVYV